MIFFRPITVSHLSSHFQILCSAWLWYHSALCKFQHDWIIVMYVMGKKVLTIFHSDTIWQHRSGSTLAQVMAWCRQAPSYYLNQCWLIVRSVLRQSPESNFTRSVMNLIVNICLPMTLLKYLPGANELIWILDEHSILHQPPYVMILHAIAS